MKAVKIRTKVMQRLLRKNLFVSRIFLLINLYNRAYTCPRAHKTQNPRIKTATRGKQVAVGVRKEK